MHITTALTQSKSIELSTLKLEQKQKKVLILGWHSVAEIFIRESADYLSEGTQFDILFNEPIIKPVSTANAKFS